MSVVALSPSRHATEREPLSRDQVLRRYPRLVAHMICESLGYFSPLAAANALAFYINGDYFNCEWYGHICHCRGRGYFDQDELLKITADVVKWAIERRHSHKGPMAEYTFALDLVLAELRRSGCTTGMLASWF